MPNFKLFKIAVMLLMVVACKEKNPTSKKEIDSTLQTKASIEGYYVDEFYQQKNEGYDWVSVQIEKINDSSLKLKVRSRADKKKPTCTFDATAIKISDTMYEVYENENTIILQFLEDKITIYAANEKSEGVLHFYCSGGASFAGTYTKINEPIDETQIDKTLYSKVVSLQNVGFSVSAIEREGNNTVTISTFGLEKDFNETYSIANQFVKNTLVEDLNSDGSPEIVIITQDTTPNKKGNVYGFSVNNKKSMSSVYFVPTSENIAINEEYKGFDEFTIIETYLAQRFPIFNDGDSIENPTGGKRQIRYQLVEGEALRKFEIYSITNFN